MTKWKKVEEVTMPRVLTVDGSVKIGAYRLPDRKKPCLCVEKGDTCTVYSSFIDVDRANEFMSELATLVGAMDNEPFRGG